MIRNSVRLSGQLEFARLRGLSRRCEDPGESSAFRRSHLRASVMVAVRLASPVACDARLRSNPGSARGPSARRRSSNAERPARVQRRRRIDRRGSS